jgi:hypothetical protein
VILAIQTSVRLPENIQVHRRFNSRKPFVVNFVELPSTIGKSAFDKIHDEVHDDGGWKREFDLRELFHPRRFHDLNLSETVLKPSNAALFLPPFLEVLESSRKFSGVCRFHLSIHLSPRGISP